MMINGMMKARKAAARAALSILTAAKASAAAPAAPAGAILPATREAQAVDPVMGDYEGTYQVNEGESVKASARVAALGGDTWRVMVNAQPRREGDWPVAVTLEARKWNDQVFVSGEGMGRTWIGAIADGKMELAVPHIYGGRFDLNKVQRESPTLGQKPPAGAVVLLPWDGKTPPDISAWSKEVSKTADGAIEIGAGGGDLHTRQSFGDVKLHVEFNIPFAPAQSAQARGNSGVYLQERYEIQVLDSYGLSVGTGDCGSVYRVAAPMMEPQMPPLTWQTFDIEFSAPRLDAQGNATKLPTLTVDMNGVRIHDKVEVSQHTGGGKDGFAAKDTIRLQDHDHPVRYRNIWLVELNDQP